jgi:RNA polymerase sigma factor (sigma-70 family)
MTVSLLSRDFIIAFQHGSYESVKDLYHSYYALLTGFAEQLILNKPEAHHIVQEAFIKLYLMRHQFYSAENIKAFLYVTVRNTCFTFLKSNKPDVGDNLVAWYTNEPASANRFDDEAVRAEAIRRIYAVAEQLPRQCRNVFKLSFYSRLSVDDISCQLHISHITVVKDRIKAIRLLRDKLYTKNLFSVPLFVYFLAVAGCEA